MFGKFHEPLFNSFWGGRAEFMHLMDTFHCLRMAEKACTPWSMRRSSEPAVRQWKWSIHFYQWTWFTSIDKCHLLTSHRRLKIMKALYVVSSLSGLLIISEHWSKPNTNSCDSNNLAIELKKENDRTVEIDTISFLESYSKMGRISNVTCTVLRKPFGFLHTSGVNKISPDRFA